MLTRNLDVSLIKILNFCGFMFSNQAGVWTHCHLMLKRGFNKTSYKLKFLPLCMPNSFN